ncbi:MAG TPA: hypothetical protein VFC19_39710 [Candidatus Limnocylindrales bacterium]|nr:hypothetical protein [Candidatus Limnocylindrales bacterium]
MVSFSFHGSGSELRRLRRFFTTPKKVLWRRWRLALPLAITPAVSTVWLGAHAAPHLHPFNTGWRAGAVFGVLVGQLLLTMYLMGRGKHMKLWRHGPFPPPAGVDKGWFLLEPIRRRRVRLLLLAVPIALLQFWVQAANEGGRTLDGTAAITAWFVWAGIIRELLTPNEPAIAVTALGVYNGTELYRWEQIQRLWMEDDDLVGIAVNGKSRFLEMPHTRLKSEEVLGVINYYFEAPRERAGIPFGA